MALFQVSEPRVDDFFDAPQIGAPGVAHLVEPGVHVAAEVAQASVVDQDADENGQHGRRRGQHDREDLRIVHRLRPFSEMPEPGIDHFFDAVKF